MTAHPGPTIFDYLISIRRVVSSGQPYHNLSLALDESAYRKLSHYSCFECRLCVLIALLVKSTYPINCEGQVNAFYFRDLSVAGTNNGGHDNSGIPVAFSNHRNSPYFRHHLVGRLDFDSGPALDGIGI